MLKYEETHTLDLFLLKQKSDHELFFATANKKQLIWMIPAFIILLLFVWFLKQREIPVVIIYFSYFLVGIFGLTILTCLTTAKTLTINKPNQSVTFYAKGLTQKKQWIKTAMEFTEIRYFRGYVMASTAGSAAKYWSVALKGKDPKIIFVVDYTFLNKKSELDAKNMATLIGSYLELPVNKIS